MKINFESPISFNSLTIYNKNGINFPKDFDCNTKDKNKTPHNITVQKNKVMGAYEVQLTDKYNSHLAAVQELMIWPEFNYIFIDNMKTEPGSRGKGLGTCMHLTNIIEMMENNIGKLELSAAPSAIPFHVKCGFKPDINWENEYERKNIRAIAYDSNLELAEYAQKAQNLLKTHMNPKEKSKRANKILFDYTRKAVKIMNTKEQKNLFPHSISMVLTREDVLKNKNFYNKLFDKYGIDYQITDSSC